MRERSALAFPCAGLEALNPTLASEQWTDVRKGLWIRLRTIIRIRMRITMRIRMRMRCGKRIKMRTS